MIQALWTAVWQFNTKAKYSFTIWPNKPLFGIYPRQMETYVHKKTCIKIFKAAILIIVKDENNTNVLQQVNEYTNCGISVQWNTIQQ